MSKAIYLGYFDNQNKRAVSPAGVTMMEYVIRAIARSTGECTVISPAQSKGKKLKREVVKLEDNINVIYRASLGYWPKWFFVQKIIKRRINKRNLDRELDRIVEDNDTLVVYYSLAMMRAVNRIIKKKKIKLVLHVCEIYSDVSNDLKIREKEIDFIKKANAYIFSTKLLKEQIDIQNKPYTICLGTYTSVDNIVGEKTKEKVHVVYAGTLDSRKGGAMASVSAAEYLPENYHLHILGFGTDSEVKQMQDCVDKLSQISKCTVTYDGCLAGDEYIKFIQNCDIGLSTQNPDAAFNATSFPSKILSYMSNGLRVVSIRIPAIETSGVDKYMYYYDNQTPEEIARAIMSVDVNDDYDGRVAVTELDKNFCDELRKILEKE